MTLADRIKALKDKIRRGYYDVNLLDLNVSSPVKPFELSSLPENLDDNVLDNLKKIKRDYKQELNAYNVILEQEADNKLTIFLNDLCATFEVSNGVKAKKALKGCLKTVGDRDLMRVVDVFENFVDLM